MNKIKYTRPADIERASMEIICAELADRGLTIAPENESVVLRAIHATADFDYAENMVFTPHAVQKGIAALKAGVDIVTDTNMAKSGINNATLAKLGGKEYCYMAEKRVSDVAKAKGITRAAASMRIAAREHPGAVFVIGNAPTALLELCALMEEGFRPALVIGVPVGFVNVVESKGLLLTVCGRCNVSAIIAMGRKGGSSVAAAVCNALLYTAADTLDPCRR